MSEAREPVAESLDRGLLRAFRVLPLWAVVVAAVGVLGFCAAIGVLAALLRVAATSTSFAPTKEDDVIGEYSAASVAFRCQPPREGIWFSHRLRFTHQAAVRVNERTLNHRVEFTTHSRIKLNRVVNGIIEEAWLRVDRQTYRAQPVAGICRGPGCPDLLAGNPGGVHDAAPKGIFVVRRVDGALRVEDATGTSVSEYEFQMVAEHLDDVSVPERMHTGLPSRRLNAGARVPEMEAYFQLLDELSAEDARRGQRPLVRFLEPNVTFLGRQGDHAVFHERFTLQRGEPGQDVETMEAVETRALHRIEDCWLTELHLDNSFRIVGAPARYGRATGLAVHRDPHTRRFRVPEPREDRAVRCMDTSLHDPQAYHGPLSD